MTKVSKKVEEKLAWLNEKMNAFQKTEKHQNPSVLPSQVRTEKKVSH